MTLTTQYESDSSNNLQKEANFKCFTLVTVGSKM